MKPKSQIAVGDGFDGFDKNVAEKMPRVKKEEEPVSPLPQEDAPRVMEGPEESLHEAGLPGGEEEGKRTFLQDREEEGKKEEDLNVRGLIEDLHAQLLAANRTRRAMEIDLASSQKTILQLTQDNNDLKIRLKEMKKEAQGFKEVKMESEYLEDENTEALEKIQQLHQDMKRMRDALARANQERQEASERVRILEAQIEQNELARIKERLKEREASYLLEENRDLQLKLEQILSQNLDLEKRYAILCKSFSEVKDSLVLLRDSCKTSYYNLSESPD